MRKNFFYYLFPTVLRGMVYLAVVIPVTTYYLDPRDFGIVAIITVFSRLVIPLSSTGVGWVLGGNYYRLEAQERKELVFNMLLFEVLLRTAWVGLLGAAGGFFLPKLIKSYDSTFLLFFWLFLLAEWFNALWELVSYTIVLQRKGRTHTFLDITQMASYVIVLLVCLFLFRLRTISLILAYLGEAVGGFIFSLVYIRRYIVPRIRKKWIKEIIRLGVPTIPLNLFELISNSIEKFFIERWIGLGRLGIYNHSLEYKKMFMRPLKAFTKTYSPEVLQQASKKEDANIEKAKGVLKKWYGVLAIVGVGIVLFSKEAINILTHGKFIEAAPLVSVWFILILIYSFGIPYGQFLIAHKKNRFVIVSEIILSIVSWGLIALCVKFFGIYGAVTAIVSYFFILHSVRRIYARRLGCADFEGYIFWLILGLMLALIIFNVSSWAFLSKIYIFTGIFLGFGLYFNLFVYLKRLWRLRLGVQIS